MADDEEMEVDKEGPRFVVKKWNAVTFWSWDICTDTCAICRNKLYEPSIEAQANPGLADDAGYSIAWGCCGHVFHLDCISRWLKTRSVCPLCNREWEYAARPARPTRRAHFSCLDNTHAAEQSSWQVEDDPGMLPIAYSSAARLALSNIRADSRR